MISGGSGGSGERMARAMVAGGFSVLLLLASGVLAGIGIFLSAPMDQSWLPMERNATGDAILVAVWLTTPPLLLLVAALPALGVLGARYKAATACGAVSLAAGYAVSASSDTWRGGVLAALLLVPAVSSLLGATAEAVRAEDAGETGRAQDAWGVLGSCAWRVCAAAAVVGAFAWVVYAAGEPALGYVASLIGWVAVPGVAGRALERATAGGAPDDPAVEDEGDTRESPAELPDAEN